MEPKLFFQITLFYVLFFGGCQTLNQNTQHHVWEKIEIEFESKNSYKNPYTDVEIWIDLKGPGFEKRCYGFWDGENIWKVRIMAVNPGEWTWVSGSNQKDWGLNNKKGTFKAIEWTEHEKVENPLRRGMVKADKKGHSFEYADGTSMFWLADTWWPCMTQRYYWHEDDSIREVGSKDAGFKDYVRFRKEQGYNGCMVIAAFPNWLTNKDGWGGGGWEDEAGNWSFELNKNGPDLDRLNPEYFKSMDKKVDYLNAHGFIPFIEASRRDIADFWKENFEWPESYARYVRYLYFRYQGNIVFNSPIHLDARALTKEDWNQVANSIIDDYKWPTFGHMASANPPGNTFYTFGHTDEARWLSFHGVGNKSRDHHLFEAVPKIFRLKNPVPIVVNEPYYDGLKWGNNADLGSDLAAYYCRVALYGSVLSGALAGHVYGADNIWRGNEHTSETFLIQSAEQMKYINDFLFSEGDSYIDLVEAKQLLKPHQTSNPDNNMGWSYCLSSENSDLYFLYFEQGCQKPVLSKTKKAAKYIFEWFNPENGQWSKSEKLISSNQGFIEFPDFPNGETISTKDWALKIKLSKN